MSVLCREKTSGKKGIVTPTEQLWCFPTCQLRSKLHFYKLKENTYGHCRGKSSAKGIYPMTCRVQVINIAVFNSTISDFK